MPQARSNRVRRFLLSQYSVKALIFALMIATGSSAKSQERLRSLDEVQQRLYSFISESQSATAASPRELGGWNIHSDIDGAIVSHEPNSHLTAQIMVLLHDVSRRFELPGYDAIEGRANAHLAAFLHDSSYTGEPAGTIAFWPIRDYRSGRRGVSPSVPALSNAANVPNDLDTSSQAVLWFLNTRQNSSFARAFTASVSEFRDVGRIEFHPNDLRWKRANSGAFLTWADSDSVDRFSSRIPDGINDVDCVVGLHVLSALQQARRWHKLDGATERGFTATCRLIGDAVRSGAVPTCSVYYPRASQFWWAFAQASSFGVSCLDRVTVSARWRLLTRATEIAALRAASTNGTEVAEVLGSLKRLYPPTGRPERIAKIVSRLEAVLSGMVSDEGRLITDDSIALSRGFTARLEWHSPAYSSALSLVALTLP